MKFKNIGLVCFLGMLVSVSAWAEQPNIVLIFIDDMGYADIGPFGNTQLRTPHLDTMAKEGRRFTNFYAAPTCTMSRARLMTGCYNPRVSMTHVLFPGNPIGLNPEETTIAEVLKQKGYATACVGKWHLGDVPKFLPLAQGFDEYFGLPYSNDMHAKRKYKGNLCPPLPVIRGVEVIETEPDQALLTKRYTEEAVRYIGENRDGPFFLYLAHTMIHFPLAASEAFKGKSSMGLIGDTIEEIDWSVGQVLEALKANGLEENTLVIFTSDNGPAKRPAPPLRGEKGSNWEGGVRVPTIMKWPGHIPAGTDCDKISGVIDLLPTFASIVNQPLDPERILDGRDISSLLTDAKPAAVHDYELYFQGGRFDAGAIRRGDWKLIVQPPARKPAEMPGKGPWLYNLKTDLGEQNDVASEHPEIVERLAKEIVRHNAEIARNKRPIGRIKKGN